MLRAHVWVGAGIEEGGGATGLADAPPWLAVRLAAAPQLDDGRWARTASGMTPGQVALDAELRGLVPEFLGGSG